ncbi:MAG TPA: methylmalonyl Co-A mutase-associated GTPase MeaB [Candidatus Poseidoniales archaeon]|nr:methylmalonyl Co-A mutase-associated GTPase MeaB [Euryarchaeota archaeon]DAC56589.1 MAG TPA: methylmalonyl Co-A mutase-associated GTPase MeaB [Candidatus Poseidoniales archaeon]
MGIIRVKRVSTMSDEFQQATGGDRRAMARLLSKIENGSVAISELPLKPFLSDTQTWSTMAITGAPGVGKSVLVDALMTQWASAGRKVALLAVDPSSPRTGGALLGDRVRMSSVDNPEINQRVYVRSIATRSSSGSVPLIVEDMATLLLACGWEHVLIETVGSGQAELRCAAVADRIVVVEGPARGDGIQAEKAGLLELADIVLVNKADLDGAERHAGELRESYSLGGEDAPVVLLTSGLKGLGVAEAAEALLSLESSGRALRARMRERLLGQHERRLVLHPSYNAVLNGLCEGTLDIEEALNTLQGD